MTPRPPLPLSAASARLRGKPGRPRVTPAPSPPSPGHTPGTLPPQTRINSGPPARPPAAQASALPRLLDLGGAAAYLSVSPWTIRDMLSAGTLSRVLVPGGNGRELRKLLFDRADLDRLVDTWKA